MNGFESLGKEVARQQDEQLARDRTAERALEGLRWPAAQRSSRWVAFAVAAAVLFVAISAWLVWPRPALSIETAGVPQGVWSSADTDQPVAFSDGATVLVSAGSRYRLSDLTADGAKVSVERGRVSASVPHRDRTKWHFELGPFTVKVVGTRFEAAWDPTSERFELTMTDGAVELSGPTVEGRRTVVAGQSVNLSLAPPPQPPPSRETPEPLAPTPLAPTPPLKRSESTSSRPEWKTLAAQRDYDGALARARPAWATLLRTTNADDLLLLADVARLTNERALAKDAYLSARRRFVRTPAATTAAFFLGRLAFDAGNTSEATAWFTSYRAEAPTGPFAAESLGRLLELSKGNPERAKVLAAEYLAAYPDGPHARLARALRE